MVKRGPFPPDRPCLGLSMTIPGSSLKRGTIKIGGRIHPVLSALPNKIYIIYNIYFII